MTRTWVLAPADAPRTPLTAGDLARLGFRAAGRSAGARVVYDTFDWRLHRSDRTLVGDATGTEPALVLATAGGERRQPVDELADVIRPLPSGPVAEDAAGVVGERAVLARARVAVDVRHLRLLDDEDKTIARCRWETVTLPGDGVRTLERLVVEALRGYDGEVAAAVAALGADGLVPGDDRWRDEALAAAGCRPGDYSSRLDVALRADEPADRALARVFLHLLDAIEANEDGVRRDLDPEFLHDLRVAVRRTRSLLKVAAPVLGEEDLAPFVDGFRWLAAATGPLRDLDVHLHEFDDLARPLSSDARADLALLRDELEAERVDARRALVAVLDGARYRRLLTSWRGFLHAVAHRNGAGPATATDAVPSIDVLAAASLRRAFRRMVKRGRAIDDRSPDEALHDLRKRGKELRYQIEAFAGLADPEAVAAAVADLKHLQDVLGSFNDRCVQQDALRALAGEAAEHGRAPTATLLAAGMLLHALERQARRDRARFADAFAAYDQPATAAHLAALVPERPATGPSPVPHPSPETDASSEPVS